LTITMSHLTPLSSYFSLDAVAQLIKLRRWGLDAAQEARRKDDDRVRQEFVRLEAVSLARRIKLEEDAAAAQAQLPTLTRTPSGWSMSPVSSPSRSHSGWTDVDDRPWANYGTTDPWGAWRDEDEARVVAEYTKERASTPPLEASVRPWTYADEEGLLQGVGRLHTCWHCGNKGHMRSTCPVSHRPRSYHGGRKHGSRCTHHKSHKPVCRARVEREYMMARDAAEQAWIHYRRVWNAMRRNEEHSHREYIRVSNRLVVTEVAFDVARAKYMPTA
jgi:hypothetical protein